MPDRSVYQVVLDILGTCTTLLEAAREGILGSSSENHYYDRETFQIWSRIDTIDVFSLIYIPECRLEVHQSDPFSSVSKVASQTQLNSY